MSVVSEGVDMIIRVAGKLLALFFVVFCLCSLVGILYKATEAQENKLNAYEYAYITLPNGQVVEGNVHGVYYVQDDTIRITLDDVVYMTGSNNVVLMARRDQDLAE